MEKPINGWTIFQEAWSFLEDLVVQLLSDSSIRYGTMDRPSQSTPMTTILYVDDTVQFVEMSIAAGFGATLPHKRLFAFSVQS
jgi:hypothetical protein